MPTCSSSRTPDLRRCGRVSKAGRPDWQRGCRRPRLHALRREVHRGGFSGRPREFAAHPRLLSVARKVRRDKAWIARIRNPADDALPPQMHIPSPSRPWSYRAGSVDRVSSRGHRGRSGPNDHELFWRCLHRRDGGLRRHLCRQPRVEAGIVVRGVSDMTANKEPGTDKIRQPIAACHAAAFAFRTARAVGNFLPL